MKLAVSNIAWETAAMDEHLALLAELGVAGLELSPSMVWPEPVDTPDDEWRRLGERVARFGLRIVSAHSLTYPRPDLHVFASEAQRQELIRYLARLARQVSLVGCPHLVFGSARSRQIGSRERAACLRLLAQTCRELAARAGEVGVALLIEPLSHDETDCINTLAEAAALQQEVAHPGFGLHVDLKSSFAEGEDLARLWQDYGPEIRHCHVADPGLRPPSSACPQHRLAAAAMQRAGYARYLSIEMGRRFGDTRQNLRDAVAFVRQTYLQAM